MALAAAEPERAAEAALTRRTWTNCQMCAPCQTVELSFAVMVRRALQKRNGKGYVLVYRPAHPKADWEGYVFEHRVVMEEWLGGPLRPGEEVHHRDRVPWNNARENLILFENELVHDAMHDAIKEWDRTGDRTWVVRVERGCREYEERRRRECHASKASSG